MAALNFPDAPATGDKFPVTVTAGLPQYTWDGEKWTTIGGTTIASAPATAVPLMDATPGVVGTSIQYARQDHVHPTDTSRVADTGDTMTGPLNITGTAPTIALQATGPSGQAIIPMYRDGLARWIAAMSAGPDSGSNVGSDFFIGRYTDSGSYIDAPIQIARATGRVSLLGDPTSALHAATKGYVDTNAVAVANTKVSKTGDTMSGLLTANGGIALPSPGVIGQAGPSPNLITGATHAFLSFLVSGVWGGNFGISSDGNPYIGGWSYGTNTYYRVWTSRDFANPGNPVGSVRLAFAGDDHLYYGKNPGGGAIESPWFGSVAAGINVSFNNVSFDANEMWIRYRYVQMYVAGGWVTVNLA